jgi:hypothetical protein
MLRAEAIVVDSCSDDGEAVKKALEFIDRHSKEVTGKLY